MPAIPANANKNSTLHVTNPALGKRAILGPGHFGVDIGINKMIERCRRSRNQGDAKAAKHYYIKGHHFIGCQKHTDQRAKQHQQDNPGFTQSPGSLSSLGDCAIVWLTSVMVGICEIWLRILTKLALFLHDKALEITLTVYIAQKVEPSALLGTLELGPD